VWSPHDGRGPVIALVLAAVCAAVAGICSSLRLRTAPATAATL
jgi:DHA2 family multidrug resistance protein-like MFS transporter